MAVAQYSDTFWFPNGSLAASIPARVFEPNTNTLATLWADAGGTVPLPQPVMTSAAGLLTFWADEGEYWLHLDTETFRIGVGAGAQPVTQQDITDAIAAEVARADAVYLAQDENLADVDSAHEARGSLAAGTAVVPVAPPTGVAATDQAAVEAALAALPAGGGVLQLQGGTYAPEAPADPADGCISLPGNVVLAGMGMGVTVLRLPDGTSADVTGIVRTPGGEITRNVTVRDLTIDGNADNVSGTPTITGFYCGVTPGAADSDEDIALTRVEVTGCTGYGIDPHERTTRLLLLGCHVHDCGTDGAHDGITLDAVYDSQVIVCHAHDNGRHGINLVTGAARVEVIGCHAHNNGGNGITLQTGAKDNKISTCTVRGNTGSGVVINGVPQGSGLDTDPGRNNAVTDCTIEANGTHGIQLVGASGNRITGNTIRDSSQAAHNTSDQVRLQPSGAVHCTGNVITGNDIDVTAGAAAAPKYGIRENDANQNGNIVQGNRVSGAVTAQVSLQGPASVLAAAHNGADNSHPIGVYSDDLPSLHGYVEWNYPAGWQGASAGVAMVAGTVYGLRIDAQAGEPISSIVINIGTPGTSMTAGQCVASVINAGTGAELARTGDISTLLQGSGITPLPLLSTIPAPTPGTRLAAMLLGNTSGSMPQLVRSSSTSVTGPNAGLTSTSPRKYFTAGTGQTSLPSSFTMSATTASGALTFWVALDDD